VTAVSAICPACGLLVWLEACEVTVWPEQGRATWSHCGQVIEHRLGARAVVQLLLVGCRRAAPPISRAEIAEFAQALASTDVPQEELL